MENGGRQQDFAQPLAELGGFVLRDERPAGTVVDTGSE
jgi:hypothetical protein